MAEDPPDADDGDEAADSQFGEDTTEREGDPFETFGDVPDRDGDPFADLDGPTAGPGAGPANDDPASDPAADHDTAGDPETPGGDDLPGDAAEADPFADLADREGDPFGVDGSVFESVDVGSIDADGVWESLAGDATPGGDTRYADVSKHRYCEQCEHFSAPPEARCTREGTEIIEFRDMDTVRVFDCPVVAEYRAIERDG